MNLLTIIQNSELIKNYLSSFSAQKIGIFGSHSRNQQNDESDLDLIVKFEKDLSLFKLAEIELRLSEMLGIKVDLVTENSIKNQNLRKEIEKEVIYI